MEDNSKELSSGVNDKQQTLTRDVLKEIQICRQQMTVNFMNIDQLRTDVEMLKQRPDTNEEVQALKGRLANLEREVKDLQSADKLQEHMNKTVNQTAEIMERLKQLEEKCDQLSETCEQFTKLQTLLNANLLRGQARLQFQMKIEKFVEATENRIDDIELQLKQSSAKGDENLTSAPTEAEMNANKFGLPETKVQTMAPSASEEITVKNQIAPVDERASKDIDRLKREISKLKQCVTRLQEERRDPDTDTRPTGASCTTELSPDSIVFSAGVTTGTSLHIGDRVIMNQRNCTLFPSVHMSDSGEFIVPRNGVYDLAVTLWQGGEGKLEVGLGWGGNRWWWHLGRTQAPNDVISTSMVRRFTKNDIIRVWMIRTQGRAHSLWCTFTGRFMHPCM